MTKPIYDSVIKYALSCPERFHMPAHFGANLDDLLYSSSAFDITELDFSDNLQNPNGIILESEIQAAKIYKSQTSLYFTTGATTAIFVAIGALRARGRDIIIQRNCHKSVYSAVRHFGLNPHYIYSKLSRGLPSVVTPSEVRQALSDCPNAAAIVITSPTYFGDSASLDIVKIAKQAGIPLIVDEAHGAHFCFSNELPQGFSEYADMAVVSLHKTMPVYGGGAILNVNNKQYSDVARTLRSDLHTTSPSYVVLASMDYAIDELNLYGEVLYEKLKNRIDLFKENLKKYYFYPNDDFSRLCILLGKKLIDKLQRLNIMPELVYCDYAVFIVSPYNMERLAVLEGVLLNETPEASDNLNGFQYPTPQKGNDGSSFELVSLSDAVGRSAYNELGIYPPGIPLVAHGEIITSEIQSILMKENNVFGFVNGKVCVTI
ncbi:MAG: aminotransferase class I/II-fold pyridoxal phosphate-dependent enzyme [Clostridia bacterium]